MLERRAWALEVPGYLRTPWGTRATSTPCETSWRTVMGDAAEDRHKAHDLPEGDVVRLLLEQHARVRDLFAQIEMAPSVDRQEPFDELRALLAVHETAEEIVLRPKAKGEQWKSVAMDRNREEEEANQLL